MATKQTSISETATTEKVRELAKKENRSFNQMVQILLEKGLGILTKKTK